MKKQPVIAGIALASSLLAAPLLQAGQNPFAHTEVQSAFNFNQEQDKGHAEGACGEGKCGENMGDAAGSAGAAEEGKKCPEGKCGEGKCGEGVCGADKCGEGKCGEATPDK